MAKYEVLRPVEHDGKLYLPKSDAEPPTKARSAGNGQVIPVDASGVIELTAEQAAAMQDGQVAAVASKKAESKKQKAE